MEIAINHSQRVLQNLSFEASLNEVKYKFNI